MFFKLPNCFWTLVVRMMCSVCLRGNQPPKQVNFCFIGLVQGRVSRGHLSCIREHFPIFKTARVAEKDLKDNKHIASICRENVLGYLFADIICSSKLRVFLELV